MVCEAAVQVTSRNICFIMDRTKSLYWRRLGLSMMV
jgi:hypothetical protein